MVSEDQARTDFGIGFSGSKTRRGEKFVDRKKTARFPCGADLGMIGSFRPIALKKSEREIFVRGREVIESIRQFV